MIHLTQWPLISLILFVYCMTRAYGHTTDPVITGICTSCLTITSNPSRSLILKLPFQNVLMSLRPLLYHSRFSLFITSFVCSYPSCSAKSQQFSGITCLCIILTLCCSVHFLQTFNPTKISLQKNEIGPLTYTIYKID